MQVSMKTLLPSILKALAVWFGILVLAILNGMLREAVLLPAFGAPLGMILSGILLVTALAPTLAARLRKPD